MRVRLARQGEGKDVARLAEMALQGRGQGDDTGDLAEAIDAAGGKVKVPFGHAYAFVADEDGAVCGLLYTTPPVRLAEDCEEFGAACQQRLAERVAEIELLAVEEEHRGRGMAKHLLDVGEISLRQRGCGALLVQVLADDEPVKAWYKRQGYRLLGPGEVVALRVGGELIPIASTGTTYLTGVKHLAG
ncbi:GNAT family N-acetyltransferase [Streptomyces luteogriseus]|uniref:GNAT family N-acetyltransferase n=1 Tax=Streptomyces luteogriseus TaxID=68233 RepID=UPI00379DF4A7